MGSSQAGGQDMQSTLPRNQRPVSAVSRRRLRQAAGRAGRCEGLSFSEGAMQAREGVGAAERSVYGLKDRSGGC